MLLSSCEASCGTRAPATPAARGLKRTTGSSPASSSDNLVTLHATVVIQRAVRARAARRRRGGACVSTANRVSLLGTLASAHAAPPPAAAEACERSYDAAPAASTSPADAAAAPGALLRWAGAALLAGVGAIAFQGPSCASPFVPTPCDLPHAACHVDAGAWAAPMAADVPGGGLDEIESVAAAEAAAAAEAGLQSVNSSRAARSLFGVSTGGNDALERAVLAVLLRYALVKLMSSEHVDALLSSELGSFAASLTLGSACGLVARATAARMQAVMARRRKQRRASEAKAAREAAAAEGTSTRGAAGAGDASPLLPARPPRRRGRAGAGARLYRLLSTGGLTRAFGLGAVQLCSFNVLKAAEAACSAQLPQDGGLLLAGAAAGSLAAMAAAPLDASMAAVRGAARSVLRGDDASKARLLLALDVTAFVALEAACAQMGLDPVLAL
jgi:hypothetical protein